MTTIQPRTSVVTIFQGDYLDRIRHLERQHEAAVRAEAKSGPRLLSEIPDSHRLADEHVALVAEAEESAIDITLTALGRKAWRALVAAHPPREGHEDDATVGVNEDTFKDPLITASIVSPALSEADLDMLSEGDNDRLYLTCWALNRAPVADPKALTSPVSQPNPASVATLS